jgi:23S rRNA (adenine2503-C2)-methyltransferase
LEYLLLGGVNDKSSQAKELAELCKTLRCNVNLIRYNEVPDLEFKRPENAQVKRFQDTLTKGGVNSHIRASRGRDISAACGQLKRENQVTIEESS